MYVQVIYRHGDRAPIKLLPSGLNKTHLWPNGLGILTDIGIKQHFQLGKYLIKRYNKFINKKYNHEEIYVRSTDKDRALMSAQSNLAGMFHDKDNMIIQDLKWRPIPVHTVPLESDITMNPKICQNYNIEVFKMYKSKRFLPRFQFFQETLNLLRRLLHMPNLQFKDLSNVYDVLLCEKLHNITWDSWVTEEIYKNLTIFSNLEWEIKYYGNKLRKLSGGLFLNEITNNMKNMTLKSLKEHGEKMRIYSGHDTDLAALMAAIGIYDNRKPPYASCLLVELWKISDSNRNPLENVAVKMFYSNDTQHTPYFPSEIVFKECKSRPCTLKEFINTIQPRILTPSEYYSSCFQTLFLWILGLSLVFGIALLVFVILFILYFISNSKKGYESL